VVEGQNFVFGRDRTGTAEVLAGWCRSVGAVFEQVPDVEVGLCDCSQVQVSSTLARWLVARGRVRDAARVLGRAHQFAGDVVRGRQRGRTIGFPTANVALGDQVVPSEGVYAGRAQTADGAWHPAAISVGDNPTFGDQPVQVEVHLIRFDGDLYGSRLRVELFEFLRGQRKFAGIEALKVQLGLDVHRAGKINGVSGLPVLTTC
jgi:riboflavin kinase / FMN adenylyltransferase